MKGWTKRRYDQLGRFADVEFFVSPYSRDPLTVLLWKERWQEAIEAVGLTAPPKHRDAYREAARLLVAGVDMMTVLSVRTGWTYDAVRHHLPRIKALLRAAIDSADPCANEPA